MNFFTEGIALGDILVFYLDDTGSIAAAIFR